MRSPNELMIRIGRPFGGGAGLMALFLLVGPVSRVLGQQPATVGPPERGAVSNVAVQLEGPPAPEAEFVGPPGPPTVEPIPKQGPALPPPPTAEASPAKEVPPVVPQTVEANAEKEPSPPVPQTAQASPEQDSAPPASAVAGDGEPLLLKPRSQDSGMDEISLGVMRPWYARGFTPLLIVMGLIGSAYWAAKRYLPAARSAECGMLNIVARTNVSPKQTLALIQLSRRFVLLGITADRIEPLCSITDPNEVAELALKLGTEQGGPTFAFSEALNEQARDYADALEEDGADPNVSPQQVAEATKQLTGLVGKLKQLRAG